MTQGRHRIEYHFKVSFLFVLERDGGHNFFITVFLISGERDVRDLCYNHGKHRNICTCSTSCNVKVNEYMCAKKSDEHFYFGTILGVNFMMSLVFKQSITFAHIHVAVAVF